MGSNLWGNLKLASANGAVYGGYPYSRNQWFVGSSDSDPIPVPLSAAQRVGTIGEMLALMVPGDVGYLGPGAYDEGNLVVPATLTNITLIGAGNRGSVFIEPSTAGDEGLTVLADLVTLINVGVADGGSGDFGLSVGNASVSPDRFRAHGCKFEGSAIGARLYGAGDILLEDCEFAWANVGLQLRSNLVGFNTQIFVQGCRFHNNATVCLGEFANAQQVNNLQLLNNIFDQLEDGTEPTDFILLQDNANTGIISGNQFALATNATAKLTIGTGLMWGPNGTEAGWSSARPA